MSDALPDLLAAKLRLVIVGTAAGTTSAKLGNYYARPGNRFWSILYETRMTPTLLQPEEYPSLLNFGIGLTDLAKQAAGVDSSLSAADFDVAGFQNKMRAFRPKVVAFNGLKAASAYFGRKLKSDSMGKVIRRPDDFDIFIVAQTSGGNGHWGKTSQSWHELAKQIRALA